MMDREGIRRRLLERAQDVVMEASRGMKNRLDEAVPVGNYTTPSIRDQSRPKLKDTYGQEFFTTDVSAGVIIRYTAEHAKWTDEGTAGYYTIPGGGASAGRRLKFFWDNEGIPMNVASVLHPGNMGSSSLNWFSNTATPEAWEQELRNALR